MFCTTSETEGEVGPVKLAKDPEGSSFVVVPSCLVFGVRVSVTFHNVS